MTAWSHQSEASSHAAPAPAAREGNEAGLLQPAPGASVQAAGLAGASGETAAPLMAHWAEPGGPSTTSSGGAVVQQKVPDAKAQPDPVASSDPRIYTVTDKQALLRDPHAKFKATGKSIPVGTRVQIKEEWPGTEFVNLVDHGAGTEIGCTARSNLGDVHFAQAGASFVYAAAGQPLMVYVPPGLKPADPVDVFLFFHGDIADYASDHKDQWDHENPAKAADMAGAVSRARAGGRNVIGIAPQVNDASDRKSPYYRLGAGSYEEIVTTVFRNLREDLHAQAPLPRGAVSLAGHSGGGKALGQAAADLEAGGAGVTDITVQEGGYSGQEGAGDGEAVGQFAQSFQLVRDWLLVGKGPKTLRIVTKAKSKGSDTRSAFDNYAPDPKSREKRVPVLGPEGIGRVIKQKGLDLTVDAGGAKDLADEVPRTGGMHLLRELVIKDNKTGAVQGTVLLFLLTYPDTEKRDPHFAVRDDIMGASVAGTPKDKPEDFGKLRAP